MFTTRSYHTATAHTVVPSPSSTGTSPIYTKHLPSWKTEQSDPHHRSEVVGRPLSALLANDGARVFSVDIDSIQEYTKRPTAVASAASSTSAGGAERAVGRAYHPRHVVRPAPPEFDLARCLALSDVVISAVPSAEYKVPTAALKDGCVCVNVAADKNFEPDVRDKVRGLSFTLALLLWLIVFFC